MHGSDDIITFNPHNNPIHWVLSPFTNEENTSWGDELLNQEHPQ